MGAENSFDLSKSHSKRCIIPSVIGNYDKNLLVIMLLMVIMAMTVTMTTITLYFKYNIYEHLVYLFAFYIIRVKH